MKVAIVYDRVNKFGGAERVLMALKKLYPKSVLFTAVFDKATTPWIGDWEVRTSFIQRIPFAKNHHEWFGWLMPLAFETFDFSGFDVVISVTSEAAKGVITKPGTKHICYCLTPTRYLWSHTQHYEGKHFRGLKRAIFSNLREWDFIAAKRPDKIIAISQLVSRRIQKYYRRNGDGIIYPPVQMSNVKCQMSNEREYFLVVSRLVPYKKVDVAIRACLKLQKQLVIVGAGSDEEKLKELAGKSDLIRFAGFVSDEKLGEYYVGAKALLCPQEEDFGIVAVEAQSYGVPVVSYRKSGVAETIIDRKTGLLYDEDLVSTLEQFDKMTWDAQVISHHTHVFSTERFMQAFADIVQ